MASDYDFIRKDNERKYGTDIDRIGSMLHGGQRAALRPARRR
jgi:hypothetical protein